MWGLMKCVNVKWMFRCVVSVLLKLLELSIYSLGLVLILGWSRMLVVGWFGGSVFVRC